MIKIHVILLGCLLTLAKGQSDYDACASEADSFHSCVGLSSDGINECGVCVAGFWPGTSVDLCDVVEETCQGIVSCDYYCSGCEAELSDYLNCEAGGECSFECAVDQPTPTPLAPPPSSPTSDTCYLEADAFQRCVGVSSDECGACVAGFLPGTSVDLCDYVEETCQGIVSCDYYCGGCEAELSDYLECKVGGECSFDCAVDQPTPSPDMIECPDESAAFAQCIYDNSLDGDACAACVTEFWTSSTCSGSDDETCEGIRSCQSCGPCGPDLVALRNCLSPDCNPITCPDSNPTPSPLLSPSQPSTKPISDRSPAPTPSMECPEELAFFDQCLVDNGFDKETCYWCIQGYLDQAEDCEDTARETCAAIENCECGPLCSSHLLQYVNCLLEDTCAPTTCEQPIMPTTAPTVDYATELSDYPSSTPTVRGSVRRIWQGENPSLL